VAPEPTSSAGKCSLKLQHTWQHVDARPTPCLNLELVCGGTRSLGCRKRPPGPPRDRLQTHRWAQFFGAPLGYLKLFTRQLTAGPREVPELEVRERRPSRLRNTLTVSPGRCQSWRSESWRGQWRDPLGGAGGRVGSGHHRR
jgi:hypothetical protein